MLLLWAVTLPACGPDGPGGTDPPVPVVNDMSSEMDMGEEEEMAPPRQEIARIEVEPNAATLERGETLQITASLFDEEDQPI